MGKSSANHALVVVLVCLAAAIADAKWVCQVNDGTPTCGRLTIQPGQATGCAPLVLPQLEQKMPSAAQLARLGAHGVTAHAFTTAEECAIAGPFVEHSDTCHAVSTLFDSELSDDGAVQLSCLLVEPYAPAAAQQKTDTCDCSSGNPFSKVVLTAWGAAQEEACMPTASPTPTATPTATPTVPTPPPLVCDTDDQDTNWLECSSQFTAALAPGYTGTRLEINDKVDISGTIPPSVALMSSLTWLQIVGCESLTGTLPTELGTMNNLEVFKIHSASGLTGTFPTQLGNLGGLTEMAIFRNGLTGTIPTEFGTMTSLGHLNIHTNALSGWVPVELGNLYSLTSLYLRGNTGLSGELPTEVCDLSLGNVPFLATCQPGSTLTCGSGCTGPCTEGSNGCT